MTAAEQQRPLCLYFNVPIPYYIALRCRFCNFKTYIENFECQ